MRILRILCKSPLRAAARFSAGATVLALLATASLHATPVRYNLTLTPAAGSHFGGTGTMTLDDAPSASGISDYTLATGTLEGLAFTIDGQTFTLAGARGNTLVRFLNGQLNDITFAETIGGRDARFTLDTTAGYAFYYNEGRAASYGGLAASEAIAPDGEASSPVSEPASLVLLGTGLLLSIGLLYRTNSPRFRSKVHPQDA